MGIFSKETAEQKSQKAIEQYRAEISSYLVPEEQIESVFPLIVSYFCITNKRFIFTEKELKLNNGGIIVTTIPFHKVEEVSLGLVLSTKTFKKNAIFLSTKVMTHVIEFYDGIDITGIYNILVNKII